MPRRAVVVFALAAVAGLAVVLWRASADERSIAFRVGALPRGPAAVLSPGAEVCQTPIDVPRLITIIVTVCRLRHALRRFIRDSRHLITIPPKWVDERARGENTDANAGIARKLKNRAD